MKKEKSLTDAMNQPGTIISVPKSEIEVSHCRLHQTIEVLGAGQIGPSLNKTTIPTIEMKLLPMGLIVKMMNKAGKPCKTTLIPMPNIAALQLAD